MFPLSLANSYLRMEAAVLPRVGEKGIGSVALRRLRHMRDSTEVRNEVEEIEVAFWRTHGDSIMVTVYVLCKIDREAVVSRCTD